MASPGMGFVFLAYRLGEMMFPDAVGRYDFYQLPLQLPRALASLYFASRQAPELYHFYACLLRHEVRGTRGNYQTFTRVKREPP